jgi:hypothetical protein
VERQAVIGYMDTPSFVAAALAHHDVLSPMQQHSLAADAVEKNEGTDICSRLETPLSVHQVRSGAIRFDISRLQPSAATQA